MMNRGIIGTISQQAANYRRGYPMRQCSVCSMYWHRDNGKTFGGCTTVSGNITPYGLCDYYRMLRNPFGHRLTREHRAAIEQVYDHARGGPNR